MYIWQASKWPKFSYQQGTISPLVKKLLARQSLLLLALSDLDTALVQELALRASISKPRNIVLSDFDADENQMIDRSDFLNKLMRYETPPFARLEDEKSSFVEWYNQIPVSQEQGVLRAGISHLWLVVIFAEKSSSKKITQLVMEQALLQIDETIFNFCSLEAAININQESYFDILNRSLSCRTTNQLKEGQSVVDITDWIVWFIETLYESINSGITRVIQVQEKVSFWKTNSQTILNQRQVDALNLLLTQEDIEALTAKSYQKITGVSKATATRDLTELLMKGCLNKMSGGGRSTRYCIFRALNS